MSKAKGYCTPVQSYAPLAEHYRDRVQRIAVAVVNAMADGNIERASALYEQGVFAQRLYDHYRRIASCIGDGTITTLRLAGPKETDRDPT